MDFRRCVPLASIEIANKLPTETTPFSVFVITGYYQCFSADIVLAICLHHSMV